MMIFKKIILALSALCFLGGVVGCTQKPNEPLPDPAANVLGTYLFDKTEYKILLAKYGENDQQYTFVFSPLDGSSAVGTYVSIGVKKHFDGTEFNVTDVFHNDEYSFVYEDPIYFYSEYRKLLAGTIYVKHNGSGDNFTIRVNVTLGDGKLFSIDYKGDIAPTASVD